ncbi:MAG: hypothetical protein N3D15_01370 [Syntrophorhabdaceae bacterium]|nr:hypothetical protein [Syntrophorhabdaceae bacterium]
MSIDYRLKTKDYRLKLKTKDYRLKTEDYRPLKVIRLWGDEF